MAKTGKILIVSIFVLCAAAVAMNRAPEIREPVTADKVNASFRQIRDDHNEDLHNIQSPVRASYDTATTDTDPNQTRYYRKVTGSIGEIFFMFYSKCDVGEAIDTVEFPDSFAFADTNYMVFTQGFGVSAVPVYNSFNWSTTQFTISHATSGFDSVWIKAIGRLP